MNFVFCDPQHIKWVIPVTKELQCSNRKNINMTSFFIEKSCKPLLAPMQNKENPTSFIDMTIAWEDSLKNSQRETDNTKLSSAVKYQYGYEYNTSNSQKNCQSKKIIWLET